jgi:transposase-like protein
MVSAVGAVLRGRGMRTTLALRNISQKWNMPIPDQKSALNRFSIEFADRVPQQ